MRTSYTSSTLESVNEIVRLWMEKLRIILRGDESEGDSDGGEVVCSHKEGVIEDNAEE